MDNTTITAFPVTVFGNLEKYNSVISKARLRIFYKGGNRNGTYITDDFADKLLASIPYAPVKGIYDNDADDFTDHGEARNLGRIYGIVPADPNLTWEPHLDDDGIERVYATVDVLIYTALYTEANKIPGKSQSMELYRPSIKGDYQIIDGKKYFVYTEGCFLGLQALGDDVEPCFEGAAFFSMYQSLKDLVDKMESHLDFCKNKQGGPINMVNFKMSDNQKFEALWTLLNTNYNEENDWVVEYGICDVYDDYAVVRNYAEGTYERVYYTKDDETDSLTIAKKVRCYIIDVTEQEKDALARLHQLNNDSYENCDVNYENLMSENSENRTKIAECEVTISTLTMERDEASKQLQVAQSQLDEVNAQYALSQENLATVTTERDALAQYKKTTEDAAKAQIIATYIDQLSADVIEAYTANMSQYTNEELDMKLTYEVKKAHPEVFSKTPVPQYVPKDTLKTGIESILDKYEKH